MKVRVLGIDHSLNIYVLYKQALDKSYAEP